MKIDKEEAKHQAQKRKEAIERAKTLQYYQTDRVKTFHVSKIICNIMLVTYMYCTPCRKLHAKVLSFALHIMYMFVGTPVIKCFFFSSWFRRVLCFLQKFSKREMPRLK